MAMGGAPAGPIPLSPTSITVAKLARLPGFCLRCAPAAITLRSMSIAILPTPQASVFLPAPRVTASMVLGWAFAAVFFAAWGVVLWQAALVMRAELHLGAILSEANQFAELP